VGFAGAVELFFIVAITGEIGGAAISKRIRERLDEHIQQAGLTVSTSYRLLELVKRNEHESMEEFQEKVATNIQKLMNEEISSRSMKNG
jgi:siroheme synthase (precorrin-2 oxidase/ferrochelatase)